MSANEIRYVYDNISCLLVVKDFIQRNFVVFLSIKSFLVNKAKSSFYKFDKILFIAKC